MDTSRADTGSSQTISSAPVARPPGQCRCAAAARRRTRAGSGCIVSRGLRPHRGRAARGPRSRRASPALRATSWMTDAARPTHVGAPSCAGSARHEGVLEDDLQVRRRMRPHLVRGEPGDLLCPGTARPAGPHRRSASAGSAGSPCPRSCSCRSRTFAHEPQRLAGVDARSSRPSTAWTPPTTPPEQPPPLMGEDASPDRVDFDEGYVPGHARASVKCSAAARFGRADPPPDRDADACWRSSRDSVGQRGGDDMPCAA